jgi:serine/threonine protein kinase
MLGDEQKHLQLVGRACSIGNRRVTVSKYLGEGGFSFVYLATDDVSREQLVLKRMLSQTPEMETLVQNEIKLMEKLKHPKVVQYLGHSSSRKARGIEYFVLMEFCSGTVASSFLF